MQAVLESDEDSAFANGSKCSGWTGWREECHNLYLLGSPRVYIQHLDHFPSGTAIDCAGETQAVNSQKETNLPLCIYRYNSINCIFVQGPFSIYSGSWKSVVIFRLVWLTWRWKWESCTGKGRAPLYRCVCTWQMPDGSHFLLYLTFNTSGKLWAGVRCSLLNQKMHAKLAQCWWSCSLTELEKALGSCKERDWLPCLYWRAQRWLI